MFNPTAAVYEAANRVLRATPDTVDAAFEALFTVCAKEGVNQLDAASQVTYEIVANIDGELVFQHDSSDPYALESMLAAHPERYKPGSYVARITTRWRQTEPVEDVLPFRGPAIKSVGPC